MTVCLDPDYSAFFASLRDDQLFFLIKEIKAVRSGMFQPQVTTTARISVQNFYRIP